MTSSRMIRVDIERRRQRVVIRHRERRAVREYTARTTQAELADRQQVPFDLQLRESPGPGAQWAGAPFDVALQIAFLLLEVLGPEEQAFGPDDAIVFRHLSPPLRA